MKITQELIENIIQSGKDSDFGLSDPEKSVDINNYHPHNFDALAMILVGAYYSKYDLISVFAATMKEIDKRARLEEQELTSHLLDL